VVVSGDVEEMVTATATFTVSLVVGRGAVGAGIEIGWAVGFGTGSMVGAGTGLMVGWAVVPATGGMVGAGTGLMVGWAVVPATGGMVGAGTGLMVGWPWFPTPVAWLVLAQV